MGRFSRFDLYELRPSSTPCAGQRERAEAYSFRSSSASGCGSYAISPGYNGRDDTSDLDLCDVCYWRKRAACKGERTDSDRYAELRKLVEAWQAKREDALLIGGTEPQSLTDAANERATWRHR